MKAFEEGYADNDGIKIYYRDYGPKDAVPIILVQGLGGQLTQWPDNLIDLLIDNDFRPIVYDNRDIGLSTKFIGSPNYSTDYLKYILRLPLKSEYTIDDMGQDGISVLDELNIDSAHLLGMSMGGMIAQIIAANHPKRIKSFTLIASTAATPSPFNSPTREVRNLILNRSITKDASYEDRYQRAVKLIEVIGMEGYKFDTPEFKQQAIENMKRSQDDTGFSRQLLAILASKNRFKKIQSIKIPTLIVHGKDDPLLKVKNAYKMHKLITASELIIIEDMRHLIEQPILDQFKDRLIIHLNTNP
ncbi:alpha/beta hydrolase [Gammaproteobacteria bacterium]|nr:alpha/beta hydrolase [Gammaproteobacteria bacterium]